MRRHERCPSLDELLLASESELPRRRSSAVAGHLRRCPVCRERLGEVSRTIDHVREGADLLTAEALSRDWNSFHPRLRAVERAQARAAVRLPNHRWLVVAATLTLVVLAFLLSDRYATVVTAEELLSRAVSYEQARPALTRQRVRIRLTPPARETDISMVMEAAAGGTAESAALDQRLTPIARRLEQHQFRWDGALRAAAFYTWRSTLRDRTDAIFRPSTRLLGLRTTTQDGWLRQAVLIVREADYQPVRQVLTFADKWELSVEELASWLPAEPAARVAAAPAASPKPSAPAHNMARLEEAELAFRERLFDLDADWREGLLVRSTPSNSSLVLEGRVPTQARRNELEVALSFSELVFKVTVDPASAAEADSLPATSPRFDTLLSRVFPDPQVRDGFVPRAVKLVTELEARSMAFERLARRYPAHRVARLGETARNKVRALATRQYDGLVAHLEELDRHFAPVLGTSTRLSADALTPDWQSITAPLSSAARLTKDRVLNWAFSRGSDPDQPNDVRVQEALASYWALVGGRAPSSPVPF